MTTLQNSQISALPIGYSFDLNASYGYYRCTIINNYYSTDGCVEVIFQNGKIAFLIEFDFQFTPFSNQ